MTQQADATQEAREQSTLTPQDQARLSRVLIRMPYAGGLVPHWRGTTVTGLIATLEALAERLAQVAEDNLARDNELEKHRALIRGGRRLMQALLTDPTNPS